jgi:tRNA pseudouridine13 synthase
LTSAVLRTSPEDFRVEERMPFVLTGAGEHLWLKVRKRGFNTEQVAKQLARVAGVTRRDVAYAGMKDRHAVTVQWFSLHLLGQEVPDWKTALPPDMEVLETQRHARKLKIGALAGNHFEIVLRDCVGDRDGLIRRVDEIRVRGVPNYFGEQRFGRGGDNIIQARAMFAGTRPVCDRKLQGIYLSAARSLLFNEVLARRVMDGTWDRLLDGEAVILNGRRSFFPADPADPELVRRLAEGDIHPSGPLWGRGESPALCLARALELAVVNEHDDLRQGLEQAGLEHERRALRVIPSDLEAEGLDAATWRLRFSLPAGCYATVVLRQLAQLSFPEALASPAAD